MKHVQMVISRIISVLRRGSKRVIALLKGWHERLGTPRSIVVGIIAALVLFIGFQSLHMTNSDLGDEQLLVGPSLAPENDSEPVPTSGLADARHKEYAMQLVSSAENSSLDWRSQYKYIEDIHDGRGYTGGIIGFCSGTGDMMQVVQRYAQIEPHNGLVKYLPALRKVNGGDSHEGLGGKFEAAWRAAATDPNFQRAQNDLRDRIYFNPAVRLAQKDGLSTLGQFMYYDAAVVHGPDAWGGGLPDIRDRALAKAKTPAMGGDETKFLNAFLAERETEMKKDASHRDLSRIEDIQKLFLRQRNFALDAPLHWSVYGDKFDIKR